MTVGDAKRVARAWVLDHVKATPGLWAVMFGGSVNWLPDDAALGAHSDVDLWHLFKGGIDQGLRQRKIAHEGVILEPAYLPGAAVADGEAALGDWVVGSHLSVPSVIHDPTGELSAIQRIVALHYREPAWVRKRCGKLISGLLDNEIPRISTAASLDERSLFFGFTASNVHQIPIVAASRPPTIRTGGVLFAETMASMGQQPLGRLLLELEGSAGLERRDAEELLKETARAYDKAVEARRTPFYGDFYLYPAARPVMIDGARELIQRGCHREAVWWIWVTHYFAQLCLKNDAPREYERAYRAPYERFTRLLGIDSFEAFEKKARLARDLVSRLAPITDDIIAGARPAPPPA